MTEQNIARRTLYQQLMSVPHKVLDSTVQAFRVAMEDDPIFIAKAAVYINKPESGQKIRDIQDVGVITLLQASPAFPEYREAGRCTLLGNDVYSDCGMPGLPPFRIFRAERFIASNNRKAPRQMKSLMHDYFAMLEADPLRQDGVVLRNRKDMKNIWRHWHFKPSDFPRCHSLLFGEPPKDSKLAILKEIANRTNPKDQAKMVIEHKIPYVVATSVLPKLTPVVGVALIESMSPTEAVNSRSWLEASGLLQHPDIKDLYLAKVGKARANVASMTHRKSAKGVDEEVQATLDKAKEQAVKESKRIQKDTDLYIDVSGSMEAAIVYGTQLAVRIGALCDGILRIFVFRDHAQQIKPQGYTLRDMETAMRGVRATGRTSMESALVASNHIGGPGEQVVLVTDGGENVGNFAHAVSKLIDPPHIVMLRLPGERDVLSPRIESAGLQLDRFETDGTDYYVLDQVSAILGGPPAMSLVDMILATELPRRIHS